MSFLVSVLKWASRDSPLVSFSWDNYSLLILYILHLSGTDCEYFYGDDIIIFMEIWLILKFHHILHLDCHKILCSHLCGGMPGLQRNFAPLGGFNKFFTLRTTFLPPPHILEIHENSYFALLELSVPINCCDASLQNNLSSRSCFFVHTF